MKKWCTSRYSRALGNRITFNGYIQNLTNFDILIALSPVLKYNYENQVNYGG